MERSVGRGHCRGDGLDFGAVRVHPDLPSGGLLSSYTVWVPDADEVTLVIGGEEISMRPVDGGWWEAGREMVPGERYSYRVNGGTPRPDPRSGFQPEGVHGPSEVVEVPKPAEWVGLNGMPHVIYEMHIGTFTDGGTFRDAPGKIPHLKELGVDAVEVMPVAQFPGERGWGYDGVDLFAPHSAYGTPHDLVWMVDAFHSAGIAVILDVVYNHLGPDGNYLGEFGPYFTDEHKTPWGKAVNFDGRGSDGVRQFVVDNALMWLRDYGFDGLRLDAVHAIYDFSATHILEELAARVAELSSDTGRNRVLIAESDRNDPRIIQPPASGGLGMNAVWSDDLHHALHAVVTGETVGYYQDFGSLAHVAKALTNGFVYDGSYSTFRGRRHGRALSEDADPRALVICIQNHDQVGNRARGDRLGHLAGLRLQRVAAAVAITSAFTPLLFQGEEWGASAPFLYFTGHTDPKLGKAVSAGRRNEFRAFGWDPRQIPDPQDRSTFDKSKLDWTELEKEEHNAMLRWYKDLLRLRRRVDGPSRLREVAVEFSDEERWLDLDRGKIRLLANFGDEPRSFDTGGLELLLASDEKISERGGTLELPETSVAILGKDLT